MNNNKYSLKWTEPEIRKIISIATNYEFGYNVNCVVYGWFLFGLGIQNIMLVMNLKRTWEIMTSFGRLDQTADHNKRSADVQHFL